jgi:LAS superfamily LD-carboxypeptidase LdcB
MSDITRAAGYKRGNKIEIQLVSIGNGQCLDLPAGQAFWQMCEAALQDGIVLVPNSGYRSHERQIELRARYEREMQQFFAGQRKAKPAKVALAGWSDHEAGDAVDINRAPGDNPSTAQPDSPIDLWLAANAHRFGFVRTVPSEPWHWAHRPELLPGT